MRKVLVLVLVAAATAAIGCDEEGFEAAKAKREAQLPKATVAATSVAASATAKAIVRPTIKADDRKGYKVLPAVFDSEKNPVTEAKVALGRMLYYDKRLSKNHDISCNSCHLLDKYGVDNQPTSPGHKGQRGDRNSPTVYNAGGHIAQFWDGRAADLEEQAKGPILNPVEMAMAGEAQVLATLKSMPGYVEAFKQAFAGEADPITYDNMAKAIGAFERKLVTPSRFDKWLAGDDKALTDAEVAGFDKFIKLGCPTCHVGAAVGGTSFQKLGLVKPWKDQSDVGRAAVTKDDGDKMKFRVPSLRNIEKTYPYFHKGQVKTLEEVVTLMAWHQLGVKINDEDRDSVITFLKSLTGELPLEYITKPKLPESTDKTPKADPS